MAEAAFDILDGDAQSKPAIEAEKEADAEQYIHSPLKPESKAEAEQASKSNPLARLNEIMAKMQLDEQESKRRAEEEKKMQDAMMAAYSTVPMSMGPMMNPGWMPYGAGMPPAYPPMGFAPGPAYPTNMPMGPGMMPPAAGNPMMSGGQPGGFMGTAAPPSMYPAGNVPTRPQMVRPAAPQPRAPASGGIVPRYNCEL